MRVTRILFVCTANICRSPIAEAVARRAIERAGLAGMIEVDSAGTSGGHAGDAPDPRARKAASERGYELSSLRARKLEISDFQKFDLILAMDTEHLELMRRICPEVYRARLQRFMHYSRRYGVEGVPDPYFGGHKGFEVVLDYCEDAVQGLLEEICGC